MDVRVSGVWKLETRSYNEGESLKLILNNLDSTSYFFSFFMVIFSSYRDRVFVSLVLINQFCAVFYVPVLPKV